VRFADAADGLNECGSVLLQPGVRQRLRAGHGHERRGSAEPALGHPQHDREQVDRGQAVVDLAVALGLGDSVDLGLVAPPLGVSPQQAALAWLLQRSPTSVVIPGTSSLAHLRENAAASLGLPPDAIGDLDAIGG
jgi:aryl-alcohol dehydrogenase-like predicted oxidoreductase